VRRSGDLDGRTLGLARGWASGQSKKSVAHRARLVIAAIPLLTSAVVGQTRRPDPPSRPAEVSNELTVYLMTMGPGKRVWERFGHNAIWIHDPARGTDQAYNYGLFDFGQHNFLLRFIQGRMWYWMQGFPAQSYVELYRKANRSVWVQELNIPPQARRQLQQFLEWNERPENRFYHYDYYLDNCSTRVRDALDRALGGRIRQLTTNVGTGHTYRFHTQRLTSNDPPIYTGLLLALGHPVDRPISAWEEMFLPLAVREHLRNVTVIDSSGVERPLIKAERTLVESTEPTPPNSPPRWIPAYLLIGVLVGGGSLALSRAAPTHRVARVGFGFLAGGWAFISGILGILLLGLWGLTDHAAAYRNENVLQFTPLALPLVWLIPGIVKRTRTGRWALRLAVAVAGFSILGLILKAVPGFGQVNAQIIALALPAHVGLAASIWGISREADRHA
jgi:Domain of unknown function (DUF4105)